MGFQELKPPPRKAHTGAKLGFGGLTFGRALFPEGVTSCAVAFDKEERLIRVTFGHGEFRVARMTKGGCRMLLPEADWLPPWQFRALPITVVSAKSSEVILQLPEEWPAPPVTD